MEERKPQSSMSGKIKQPMLVEKSVSSTGVQMAKFDGNDFAVWKAQIQAYLDDKGCGMVLVEPEPTNEVDLARYKSKDMTARSTLLLALDNKHVKLVLHCKTAYEIWSKLTQIHEKKSQASKLMMQQEFFLLKMRFNESVEDYISRAEYLHGQLQDVGITSIDEATLVSKIVNGLPKRFVTFISSWSRVDASKYTLAELLPRLMAEEQLLEHYFKKEGGTALATESTRDPKGGPRRFGSKKAHTKGQKKDVKKKDKSCWICKQEGHWKKDCPSYNKKDGEVLVAETNCAVSPPNANEWILDSGATQHMTFDKENFLTYKVLDPPIQVRFGNNQYGQGIGIGTLIVKSRNADDIRLEQVLHVPVLRRKLLSVSSATQNGNTGEIHSDEIIIKNKKGKVLLRAAKKEDLYRIELQESHRELNLASVTLEDDLKLLHERFAHVNKETLVQMIKHSSAIGLDKFKVDRPSQKKRSVIECESCQMGKQTKKSYPSSTRRRMEQVGDRIHVDVCGPIGTPTCSGKNYFVLFKDEYSNYRHILLVKGKDEVHDCIRRCMTIIRVDTGLKVKRLYSDKGSELISNRTQDYLLDEGIVHETSAAFTPQQNGFIERDNRTVVEAARTMLKHRKLPDKLWGEAANTAVYLLNRLSNKNTDNKTPYELYFGSKPNITHLRIFGSLVYMKVQHKKRSGYQKKLENRAKPMVLVGYEQNNTYRVYEPETNKVIITREVVIDETRGYDFEKKDDTENLDYIIFEDIYGESETEGVAQEDVNDQSDVDDATPVASEDTDHGDQQKVREVESTPEPVNVSRYNLRNRAGRTYENLLCYNTEEAEEAEALIAYGDEPLSYREALKSEDSDKWLTAMKEEYDSLINQNTWEMAQLPENRRAIQCKWVFKKKYDTLGNVQRFKARLVAKGYSQRSGIDYKETFSPVVRMDSTRLLLAIAAERDLEMIHFDIKTAFLYGKIEEEVYMTQPEGFTTGDKRVCRLIKSLYGLKQAPRAWNVCFTKFLKQFQLEPLVKDSCILMRKTDKNILVIAIYVDDGLVCCSNKKLLEQVLEHLKTKFQVTVMDPKCFVGLEIQRNRKDRSLFISQEFYTKKILLRFEMQNSKCQSTPFDPNQKLCSMGAQIGADEPIVQVPYREAIGSLMYLMIGSRPDISYAVSLLSRYCEAPRKAHWNGVKRVFQYLNCTRNFGIKFHPETRSKNIRCYVDSDYSSDLDTGRSISGYVLKYYSGPIIWKSSKQSTVATSTTEAEFVAAAQAIKEVLWLRQLLDELTIKQMEPSEVFIDNQGAIKLLVNNQIHIKIKHIRVKYLFAREAAQNKEVAIKYIESENQEADSLTKALPKSKFIEFRSKLNIQAINNHEVLHTHATCDPVCRSKRGCYGGDC